MTALPTWATDDVVEAASEAAWEELRSKAVNPAFSQPWPQAAEGAKARVRDMIRAAILALAPAVEAWADKAADEAYDDGHYDCLSEAAP
jgi:hypothetical protein